MKHEAVLWACRVPAEPGVNKHLCREDYRLSRLYKPKGSPPVLMSTKTKLGTCVGRLSCLLALLAGTNTHGHELLN